MDLIPNFNQSPSVKVMINIGATLDIPTGTYITGVRGEKILNGGLGALTGVVGIGNNFKSTIMHYMMLSAASRIMEVTPTSMNTYDTEANIHESHLLNFVHRFKIFSSMDIFASRTWSITDKTVYYANKYYEILKAYLAEKKKSSSKIMLTTPFLERDGKTPLKIITPTFGEIDSFSEFETENVAKIQNDNELGDSSGNTVHMRQGLDKTRFLMELPTIATGAYHYMLMTAHVGKDIQMASGPYAPPPTKKLQHLKHGDKIKGVTDKFFFLLSNCWHAFNAAPLVNQGTKGPEYPRDSDESSGADLYTVTLRQLRSKSGPTGIVLEMVVSQSEGVLPELTEFHYIKSDERYGITGSLQHYSLDLYPDVKLSRTNIRSKIDSDAKLCRALNFTSEMCQMKNFWPHLEKELIITPKQVYDNCKALGYDWDLLLNTRGYWTANQYEHPIPFLSTMDLILLSMNKYHPYWYPVKQEDLLKK